MKSAWETEYGLLLRCPFCGGNQLFVGECGRKYDDDERGKPIYKVQCLKCGCRTKHFDSIGEAVTAWNNRPFTHYEEKHFPKRVEHPELVQLWDDMTSVRIIIYGEDYTDKLVQDLKWNTHDEKNEDGTVYETMDFISLAEIASQIKARGYDGTILVIAEDPMRGTVYRYGNYGDGGWDEVGWMCGYA